MNAAYIEKAPQVGNAPVPPRGRVADRYGSGRSFDILYVEGNFDVLRYATNALTKRGFKVTPVSNGLEAWQSLHSRKYNLIIADNDIRQMTGLELIKKIRSAGIETPIILTSGSDFRSAPPENEWLRVAAYIQKPFTLDELLSPVNSVCRSSRNSNQTQFSHLLARHLLEIVPHQDWGLNE